MSGRVTFALYNSYDSGRFREPHRRVLARAGALAMAFDLNLATFGFPFPEDIRTPRELAEWVASTTSIGHDGSYFVELAERGRFHHFPYPGRGFPPQLGEPVLTTSRPDPKKSVNMADIVARLSEGGSLMFLFGLGPRGVPRDVAAMPRMDLDITGGAFSLETCTALGAVAGALRAAQYLS